MSDEFELNKKSRLSLDLSKLFLLNTILLLCLGLLNVVFLYLSVGNLTLASLCFVYSHIMRKKWLEIKVKKQLNL